MLREIAFFDMIDLATVLQQGWEFGSDRPAHRVLMFRRKLGRFIRIRVEYPFRVGELSYGAGEEVAVSRDQYWSHFHRHEELFVIIDDGLDLD